MATADARPPRPLNVLVVDDSAVVRMVMPAILRLVPPRRTSADRSA